MNWLNYFNRNRDRRMEIPWEREIEVEPGLRRPLIRSLQRFQVGESGEGSHLRKRAASTGERNYQATIDLFIKEEQEVAEIAGETAQLRGHHLGHLSALHRHAQLVERGAARFPA